MKTFSTVAIIIYVNLFSVIAHAGNGKLPIKNQEFAVVLGKSRVIYNPSSKGQILPVVNEQDYPMLVQTRIIADGEEENTPTGSFRAVPPLFRLDGKQRAKIRIVQIGGQFPEDRESLYWVCVKGIPPSGDDSWAGGNRPEQATLMVQMSIKNCIKLLVRPNELVQHDPLLMAERLSWRLNQKELTAFNPTPFYINLSTITVGGESVESVRHIAPFSSSTFSLLEGVSGEVKWRAISDLGGEGPLLNTVLP
ncbi:fimbria/pilus periplasmic chaperone [Aeromonas sp. R9-2]|uniref:fimbria/pilus periplasmic chaperone n=1 Tax=Aeromonas sp. R9-2 TaxID=3138479 RepID=UPI0034A4BC40